MVSEEGGYDAIVLLTVAGVVRDDFRWLDTFFIGLKGDA